MARKRDEAVAYLSPSNTCVSDDREDEPRQRGAIRAFARRAGFALVGEFSDPGVSGADPIAKRPGFAKLLYRIETSGVRVVIVEDATSFAREVITQELGIIALMKRNVRVLTTKGDDLTDDSEPSRKILRQIAIAFAEYEKARLFTKSKAARDRKRQQTGKCEGRKSHTDMRPEMVALALRLRRKRNGCQLSLQKISDELARRGFVNMHGKAFAPASIASMLDPVRRRRGGARADGGANPSGHGRP